MIKVSRQLTLCALVFSLSLSGCSTNTQDQNTAIGAGTGAVAGGLVGTIAKGAGRGWIIAAGAVVGALIGGVFGNKMDHSDHSAINTAMDHNSINQPSNWKNNKTGMWYKVVPTSEVMAYKGSNYCRHYMAYGKSNGKTVKTEGIACRGQDGKWQQVHA